MLATDALIECGGKLAELVASNIRRAEQILAATLEPQQSVDILGDASAERYEKAVDIVARDQNNDGILAILAPQAMTDPRATAEKLERFAKLKTKPFLASWIGGASVAEGAAILDRADIPTFEYPDAAARAFCAMWRYSRNLDALYETPALHGERENRSQTRASNHRSRAQQQNATLLTETESKQVLAAYGIPVVETKIAKSEMEAIDIAQRDRLAGCAQSCIPRSSRIKATSMV